MSFVPKPDWQPEPVPTGAASQGEAAGLRVALFSGNYNCVRDGANKALNRLVDYLLERGAAVRVYSPTAPVAAFDPAGDLVSVPSLALPRRPEYRLATGLPKRIRDDIRRFAPTVFHLSAPDILGTKAQSFARELGVPVVTSLHTRFETYFSYYGLGFARPWAERHLRRFYARSDFVLVPNEPIAQDMLGAGLPQERVRIWGRGVDRTVFSPARRDPEWRRSHGFADSEPVILFFGRLVLEKGLDTFEAVVAALRGRGDEIRPLVIGAGPARGAMEARLGEAVFTGHMEGAELGRAVASADILVNPSVTEAFGNVNLEAMASGLAIVSADVEAAQALIEHDRSGLLVPPRDIGAYADAVEALMSDPERRKRLGGEASAAASAHEWPAVLQAVLDTYCLAGGAA